MGYRQLLKGYMVHVKELTGCDFVELATLTQSLTKREIGELRSIASEVVRDAHEHVDGENLNYVVHQLLNDSELTLDQLSQVIGNELGTDPKEISGEELMHALRRLEAPGDAM